MNRDEIMNMQPGRELDALVAEKVMGWRRAVTTDGATEYWDNGSFCSGKWVEPVTDGFRLDDYSNTWNPSESISAAWEVVKKFPIVNISRVEVFEKFQHHAVEIYVDTETNEPSRVEAVTAPEAICKAALLSLIQEDTP